MSQAVYEISNEKIRQFLIDMGFVEYESYPAWAYDLAERMIRADWKK